jgi:AraC-like DNA-binding protein
MTGRPDPDGSDPSGSFVSENLTEIVDRYARQVGITLSAPAASAGEPAGLRLDHRRIGRVRVSRSSVADDLTLTAGSAEVYAVTTISAGALHVDEERRRWTLGPGVGGLYRPPRAPRRNRIAADTAMTYLQIGRHELERQLEVLIEQYVQGPIDFSPLLPLDGSPAWLRIFRVFTDVFDDPRSAVHHPIVHEPLREAMINALLFAADHPYRNLLRREAAPARPRHVRLVIDAVRAEPERAYTVALLAGIAGVSVRTLQQGFREHLGMTPLTFLRRVRLERAHADLLADSSGTVAQVAHRWGFTHLGRFAAAYAAIYGVPPSLTRSTNP